MVSLPYISRKAKERLIFWTLAVFLTLIIWALSFQFVQGARGESRLVLSFYDVGQGDAILIRRGNTQILVDGGPNSDILSLLGEDMAPWDREIELMVLTHPHADHVTGLISVLERYQVRRILHYPIRHESKRYQRFLQMMEEEGAVVWRGRAGMEINLSGIVLSVLWPGITEAQMRTEAQRNINNASVVLEVKYEEFDVLLLGDAEKEAQIRFLSSISDVEVLKVAHQGARNGVYEPLLKAAQPELAVISVGAGNSYGHPHRSTLDLLSKMGIPVVRTDQLGTIKVMSDGESFWYSTSR